MVFYQHSAGHFVLVEGRPTTKMLWRPKLGFKDMVTYFYVHGYIWLQIGMKLSTAICISFFFLPDFSRTWVEKSVQPWTS